LEWRKEEDALFGMEKGGGLLDAYNMEVIHESLDDG
jgi:hypothetical protein